MNYFQDFVQDADPIVSHSAQILEETTAQYQSNALSKSEYIELTNDLLDYNHVIANISNMDRQQLINNAFQKMISIVSTIISL